MKKKRWKPKHNEIFYYYYIDIKTYKTRYNFPPIDNVFIEEGNCFPDEKSAKAAAKKIKKLLTQE